MKIFGENLQSTKMFEGYVAQDYYLDFAEKLDNPTKPEQNSISEQDTSFQMAEGIQAIRKLQNELEQKHRELARQEEMLNQKKKSNADYGFAIYDQMHDLIVGIDNGRNSINRNDIDFCVSIISSYFNLGRSLGLDKCDIKKSIDCPLVGIYEALEMYLDAFETMKFMAEHESWVYIPYESQTLVWAKKNYKLGELSFEIEWRIEHCAGEIDVKEFEGYLQEVKKVENS